ncbi:DUF1932 domain-containing protein [Azorhizobium doebereinerae]|uniref:DUF1932 domain-containing protein n=1 Tax=Azorhizobium doebereinerae TaxID=281091 RepID=UPI0003FBBB0A|nr:NAD(P)-dependent oxidoreductase [Azorhizobium doebereinerae]
MAPRLAIIGYGEVGTLFAADLLANGAAAVAVYDIKFDHAGLAAPMLARARDAGARAAASAADAAAGADIVLSAVTADAVLDVARAAAGYLAPGQVLFDLNSAAPHTKVAAAQAVQGAGADYVEGAVMAPVGAPRLAVPILAGGPQAEAVAAALVPLGMNIRAVSATHGRASAMKLCRSIMVKGIEALIVDCARAARAFEVEDEVFSSLSASFPGMDFATLADTMAERVATHGVRRAAEMREAADMVADLGFVPDLVRAVAEAQQRGAKAKPPSD